VTTSLASRWHWIVVVGAVVWTGCPEDATDTTPTDAFTQIYNSPEFQMCQDCHAPGAAGFVDGTETTQNWSSRASAYNSLKGNAAGLIGNFTGCNGVPLIGSTPETSLVVAVVDENIRADFMVPGFPDCDGDAIADETLRIGGQVDAQVLASLKQWISDSAPDM
jgi:hypothetical protein